MLEPPDEQLSTCSEVWSSPLSQKAQYGQRERRQYHEGQERHADRVSVSSLNINLVIHLFFHFSNES